MRNVLLAVDIGNTETKLGIFRPTRDGGDAAGPGTIEATWRIRTQKNLTRDEYAMIFAQLLALKSIDARDVGRFVLASVVPNINREFMAAARSFFNVEPLLFRPAEQQIMRISTERPGEVGGDLVAAAIAARLRRGAPVIVVTYGTATTIAAVDAGGAYAGVAIAPGIHIALDALVSRAAKLPQIALAAPPAAIGRNTVTAVQSGVIFGAVAQVEGMVSRFRAELQAQAPVVATGGLSEIIAAQTDVINEAVPTLVLEGLAHYAGTV